MVGGYGQDNPNVLTADMACRLTGLVRDPGGQTPALLTDDCRAVRGVSEPRRWSGSARDGPSRASTLPDPGRDTRICRSGRRIRKGTVRRPMPSRPRRRGPRRASAACRRAGWRRRRSRPSAGSPWRAPSGCRRGTPRRSACPWAAPRRARRARRAGRSVAPRIWPSGPVNSSGSRTSSTLHLGAGSPPASAARLPRRRAKVKRSGAQCGIVRRIAASLPRLAAAQVGRHRLVDLLRDAAGRGSSCSRRSRPRRSRRRAAD